MFTDRIKLKLVAGKGGNGVVAWRREKYVPKGGPAGGDGGPGGDVIFRASPKALSLQALRNRKLLKAENGRGGGASRKRGRSGQDLELLLPCGTLIKDVETAEVLCDLTEPGERFVACEGGRGGRGNASFKSSRQRAPNFCTPGRPGQERMLELELKLIADVGLVGFPNAGKSTLIHSITQIPVKIAPYPFTTLRPNIGCLEFDDYQRVLIADIPGIIAGASEDRGLGFEFLRHIERTKVLLFVLDASGIDGRTPWDDYEVLRRELRAYDPGLDGRRSLVALNKIDAPGAAEMAAEFSRRYPAESPYRISAQENTGLDPLKSAIKP